MAEEKEVDDARQLKKKEQIEENERQRVIDRAVISYGVQMKHLDKTITERKSRPDLQGNSTMKEQSTIKLPPVYGKERNQTVKKRKIKKKTKKNK